VLVGLDGLDPELTRRFMRAGKLPNLEQLSQAGCFHRLGTTYPAMSPVAWSSFATGTSPAKHGIFDFLTRDPRNYMPDLSSAEVRPPRRHLSLGPYRIPLGKPEVKLLRRSKPFWNELGRYGVPSSVLRVPITFPAEPFAAGTMLSAMCVPDLEGTQGTFTHFTSAPAGEPAAGEAVPDSAKAPGSATEGGRRVALVVEGDRVETWIEGPPSPLRRDGRKGRVKLRLKIQRAAGTAVAEVDGKRVSLVVGEYSDWLSLAFPIGLGIKMRGICRLRLLEVEPHVRLYMTPINIDPDSPVLPISHPRFFATYLSKLIGRYATLGLAEDTWALNEGVIDEEAFLEQAWANHAEREEMFFTMLERTRRGMVACVFDGTDRIQHMFMRYLDEDHPARNQDAGTIARHRAVIEDTYRRMDEMVGRVMAQVDPSDSKNLVLVLSDHGFQTFRRGVNLNAWLLDSGYLYLQDGREESGEWFDGVDWSRTRAFALGLGGIFLNVAGREGQGIVDPGQAEALADEIAGKLSVLVDPELGQKAVRKAYASHSLFSGPYADQAPDIIVGYQVGWRISWEGARGVANRVVFSDNTKAWSGDHCIDPELVPGVLIANRALGREGGEPHIMDIAPTVLDLFGIPAPRYMDGASLAA
jgi:predicted AlkP superfamily phosphohydrolase/phosphomutase